MEGEVHVPEGGIRPVGVIVLVAVVRGFVGEEGGSGQDGTEILRGTGGEEADKAVDHGLVCYGHWGDGADDLLPLWGGEPRPHRAGGAHVEDERGSEGDEEGQRVHVEVGLV